MVRDTRRIAGSTVTATAPTRRRHAAGQPTNIETNGRIPAEVIQRIVRQNFGRFRLCYENGLRNNPNLQGRVAVSFVIGGADGTSPAIASAARHTVSFGVQTWPHRLVRVMIAEQVYRALSIEAGTPYHRE